MVPWRRVLVVVVVLMASDSDARGVEENYCGEQNCYDILGLQREAAASEIRKAYRSLSLKVHPDKNKDARAVSVFRDVARAYEVLSDQALREAYDYFLDHPNEHMSYQYMRYYQAAYAPKSDWRVVLLTVITLVSLGQYLHQSYLHKQALRYIRSMPQFKNAALLKAQELGRLDASYADKSKKERDLAVEEALLSENGGIVEISGGYGKASVTRVLAFKLLLLPFRVLLRLWQAARWFVKFTILKQPYGPDEKVQLTYYRLGLSKARWDHLEESQRQDLLDRNLWDPSNYDAYVREMEEDRREKMAGSAKYKQYRRFMKQHKH
eukprot:GILJ01009080.1.p1 GENE.GILJ01009080.1~~GILJ01009080.1.p1  ORF type:complete len:323 (-),score=35.85 GILJ01009080.1:125-1093(-)